MERLSNFQFLQPYNLKLLEAGILAERLYMLKEPISSLGALRAYGELLAIIISDKLGINSQGDDQNTRLQKIEQSNQSFKCVKIKFHKLRQFGNNAVHVLEGDFKLAEQNLRAAYEIGVWYCKIFLSKNNSIIPDFQLPDFLSVLDTQEVKSRLEELSAAKQKVGDLEQELETTRESVHSNQSRNSELEANLEQAKLRAANTEHKIEQLNRKLFCSSNSSYRITTDLMLEMIAEAAISHSSVCENKWSEGFEHTAQLLEIAESSLRQIANLIGKHSQTPITLSSGENITAGLGLASTSAALHRQANDIHQGVFNLIVIGEFKHGKSTLLNAMLGSKLLPASALPATAIITMLVSGDTEKVEVFSTDSDLPREMTLQEFNQEFKLNLQDQNTIREHGIADRFQNIEYAKIKCHHALCNGGVRLIDSPGLAEQMSRTRVATNFFQQSQAALFVLSAHQPLSEGEREFIETYFKPGFVDHVFFIINRIDAAEDHELEETKDFFRNYLKDFFLDEKGNPNSEKCNEHLFFTNAKAALNARLTEPVNQAMLEASGVPHLEQSLEKFLTSPDKVRLALSSTFKLLISIIYEASARIDMEKTALKQSLVELEQRRKASEIRLQALESREEEIKETIRVYSEIIAQKLCSNLEQYLSKMERDWEIEAQEYISIAVFNPLSIGQSLVDSRTRENSKRTIERGVQDYLTKKFQAWSEQITDIVGIELERLSGKLETEIKTFSRELACIENFFSEGKLEGSLIIDELADNREEKVLQLIVGLVLGDFSGMSSTLLGRGNWFGFIQGAIWQAAIAVFIFQTFTAGPVGWAIFIGAEIMQFFHNKNRHEEEILKSIGSKIHEELQNRLPQMRKTLSLRTKDEFGKLSCNLTELLQYQVNEVRSEQEHILNQKCSENFSIEIESKRMDTIRTELICQFNAISKATYGRTYSLDEIKWLASGKKIINDR